MEKHERLLMAYNHLREKGLVHTYTEVANKMKATVQNVSAAMNGEPRCLTDRFLRRFITAFPEIDEQWLLTGDGEMIVSDNQCEIRDNNNNDNDVTIVPLLPIAAQGGSLSYFAESVSLKDCELIISPIKGADFAMRVAGDSMSPEYPNGSQVLIKKINPDMYIEWGKVFVLDTYNGSVMKVLAPGSQPDRVRCISKNPDPIYAPFEIRWEDVIGVYRVLLCMSVK